ncbi:MAG TPA: hypothetical protein VN457_05220, partial [Chlamydiales bacterium]|nr:hypothetical protein [Chlamydiales bacterium]
GSKCSPAKGQETVHYQRALTPEKPLVVTNFLYRGDDDRYISVFWSEEREALLHRFFTGAAPTMSRGQLLEQSLEMPYVNNHLTTHKVVAIPRQRRLRVALNNGFAGQDRLHEVDTRPLLA